LPGFDHCWIGNLISLDVLDRYGAFRGLFSQSVEPISAPRSLQKEDFLMGLQVILGDDAAPQFPTRRA
jgi:hypothetical protein